MAARSRDINFLSGFRNIALSSGICNDNKAIPARLSAPAEVSTDLVVPRSEVKLQRTALAHIYYKVWTN